MQEEEEEDEEGEEEEGEREEERLIHSLWRRTLDFAVTLPADRRTVVEYKHSNG